MRQDDTWRPTDRYKQCSPFTRLTSAAGCRHPPYLHYCLFAVNRLLRFLSLAVCDSFCSNPSSIAWVFPVLSEIDETKLSPATATAMEEPVSNGKRQPKLHDAKCEVLAQHWLDLPELPQAEELMSDSPPTLPLNDVENRPQLKQEYLETQYRLHRFEATEYLRRAIFNLKLDSEPQDIDELESVRIYTKVR